ncbi:MAG: ABC transporter substrate-binding protein [Gammaproteobacteria bacterium]|nr:ABC transporter substrate-binding protein [Gammaproteobacteria bacterium]
MNFKVVINKVLFFSLLLVSLSAHATTPDAGQVVQDTVGGVLDRLAEEKEQIDAHPERIYELIQELVIPHFDFISMSKWVLGKSNWRAASEEQRDTFVDQFRTLLVRTYAKALLEYSQEKVKVNEVMENPKSNLVTVKTEVKQPGGESGIPINYRMHISGGEWKVVDVAVDGISLVRSYRGSFASEIKANGLDSLLAKLVEKNNKLASAISSE